MKKKKRKNIKQKEVKKVKLKYKNIFIFLIFILILGLFAFKLINTPITNIYISGNKILSDQEVIELAGISDYPSSIQNTRSMIESRLEKSDSIISATVTKEDISKVYINIQENRPLFFNSNTNKTVMLDKSEKTSAEETPYLINYIPDTIYAKFVSAMSLIDSDTISRISEILYAPNDVDSERFYLTMNDGNYVYLTLNTFNKINNYISMLKQFENKKGILYLDSGEYFEIK